MGLPTVDGGRIDLGVTPACAAAVFVGVRKPMLPCSQCSGGLAPMRDLFELLLIQFCDALALFSLLSLA